MAAKRVTVEERFRALRKESDAESKPRVPKKLQGVTKERVQKVLAKLDLDNADIVDCVYALLDDTHTSYPGFKFSDGANTARIGAHIAFLQRDGEIKLDREGRDYWIKPLRDIGAVEPVTLIKGEFFSGHVVAKSGNSAYRLDEAFTEILKAPDDKWESVLKKWNSQDVTRRRLELQAEAAEESKKLVDTGHKDLIKLSVNFYAKRFLPGFKVLYVDDSDGDRISEEEKKKLKEADVSLTIEDAFPDVLLWNSETDWLWCIEAVTSDGEVDAHKVKQLTKLCERHGKKGIGFTTTFKTWRAAAARQGANKNLAIGSFMWIAEDPSRQFEVRTFTQND
jgi:hypothetical protein